MLAVCRGILAGFAVLMLAGGVSGAMMIANLQLAPAYPFFLPGTVIWLVLVWRYVRGDGWPQSTGPLRRDLLRAGSLTAQAWVWALTAGGLAVTSVMGIAFMTYRVATLPDAAYVAPFEIAGLPSWTLASMFCTIALTAGVVEETAFRGYMLSAIEHGFGWTIGIGVVTLLFYLAHLGHAYATLAFVPFFMAHGLVFGLLVFYTRSIAPAIVLHAVSDVIVLPMQYGVIPSAGQWPVVWQGWLSLATAVAAVPAFRRLSKIMSSEGHA